MNQDEIQNICVSTLAEVVARQVLHLTVDKKCDGVGTVGSILMDC